MDRNLVLAVVLSGAVYLGWFKYLEHRYPPPEVPAGAATGAAAPAPAAPATEIKPSRPEPTARARGREGAKAYDIGQVSVLVQPFGAGLVSYEYPGPLGRVELVSDPDPGYFAAWPDVEFKAVGTDPHWPVFEARLPSGVVVRKEFLFSEQDALKTLRFTFTNPGKAPAALEPWKLALGPGLGTVASEEKENPSLWRAVALTPPPAGKKREAFIEADPSPEAAPFGPEWLWAGVSNRYFLAAAFPAAKDFASVVHGAKPVRTMGKSWFGGDKQVEVLEPWVRAEAKAQTLAPGASAVVEVPFYFGPKGYTHLSTFRKGLERSVSFGWFHRLGKFTLDVLHFFHRWTGNWGWAILLLTLCLQVFLLPLSWKQQKSMSGMKKVQPELARIQQKFAKEPERLQREMMEVYKKHGVNPLGGCLPILLQMPIFVALFNMLRGAWELHGQPWMFWVTDLSAHDPYYILPVTMGAIMFFQNKMNPQPVTDPAQAQMMTMMPIIMTFMFLNFPAGLVLYWLTNSVVGFASQMVFKRYLETPAA
jgi:YidC/Oxa1 family membrane protein insertase